MSCEKPCNQMEVQELAELPIDNLESVPDFFLTERTVLDETTGKVLHSITRTPGNRVVPTGNLQNCFTLDPNNDTLSIPEGQVVPCYVENNGTSNVVYMAGKGHPAQFFAIGTYGDLLLCQGNGLINVLAGTDYIVGASYYLANENGQVTTDPTQTGQKLFTVLSPTKLLINL